jgi:hypothetical membrane protein
VSKGCAIWAIMERQGWCCSAVKFTIMKNQWLLNSGFLIPIIFWTTILICGFLTPGYYHTTRMLSELGEIGTKTQHLFTIGLVLSSIFSIFFNIGLFRICKIIGLNIIPVLILWTFSFSILCAGLFSYPHWLHGLLGSPSIILFLSPMTALIFWKTNMISNIKIISLLTLLIMSLGFLIFSPNILTDYFGIKQRFFHLGWTVWFLCLTFIFIGINKRLKING